MYSEVWTSKSKALLAALPILAAATSVALNIVVLAFVIQGRNSIALLKSQQTFKQSFQYYGVSHTSHTTIKTLLKSLLRFQKIY